MKFFVPCGDGDQTLKWLSLVAAQQYELRKPQGRARYREPSNSKLGFFIPMGMTSAKGVALRDPNALINEVFTDGAVVKVELQDVVEVDSINAPVQSDWQQKSFCEGEASQLRIKAEEERKETEKARAVERNKLDKAVKDRKRMELNMNNSVSVQEFDIQAVNATQDWSMIAEVIGESSTKDQEELEDYFPTIFPTLTDIFTHFVGPRRKETANDRAPAHTPASTSMTFAEFSHFLHAARLDHAYRDSDVIKDYVLTTKRKLARGAGMGLAESKGDDDSEDFMSRTEFFACLVVVAIAKVEGTMRSADSMENLLVKYLEPNWLEQRVDDKVRVLIDGPRTSTMLAESRPYLKDVFDFYTSDAGGVVTEEIFATIMKDAGLLMRHPGESNEVATKRMDSLATSSFFAAQGNPSRHLELNELVFSEFVEATCRLALESLSGGEDFGRVQLGVDALLDLRRNMR